MSSVLSLDGGQMSVRQASDFNDFTMSRFLGLVMAASTCNCSKFASRKEKGKGKTLNLDFQCFSPKRDNYSQLKRAAN